ncbi:ParB/RepB/Spo0J family partition protein [Loktanella atrilutea]|uniref:ParB/RepB/Spo0J family partition protein n=1 Tax=Loktanella atrilutea TaxID=366533 RepID=A0A1M5EK67_LOKAT|nr:ParB N-terminal domain-containing protein [Loktanella atrilutea]SHF79605.1 ParB/RepB/Spo0J family partition protein [Loktanella atrilutea]
MAKRKRLTPLPSATSGAPRPAPQAAPETKSATTLARGLGSVRPPIAEVAHDAASANALAEVAQTLTAARAEGRLIQRLPLHLIDAEHLVRDRLVSDPEEMNVLKESIRHRGQQTAIEVVALEDGRYGLISGWRRLGALRDLLVETKAPAFETVLALVRTPADAAESYVAMVEENEIRVGLSFYERARIVVRAVDRDVFRSDRVALAQLFAAVSRSKRSKINQFITIVRQLDQGLKYPTEITERSGLALVQALDADETLAQRLLKALAAQPDRNAEEEGQIITDTLTATGPVPMAPLITGERPRKHSEPEPLCEGLMLRVERDGAYRLTGPALENRFFVSRLIAALRDLDKA